MIAGFFSHQSTMRLTGNIAIPTTCAIRLEREACDVHLRLDADLWRRANDFWDRFAVRS